MWFKIRDISSRTDAVVGAQRPIAAVRRETKLSLPDWLSDSLGCEELVR